MNEGVLGGDHEGCRLGALHDVKRLGQRSCHTDPLSVVLNHLLWDMLLLAPWDPGTQSNLFPGSLSQVRDKRCQEGWESRGKGETQTERGRERETVAERETKRQRDSWGSDKGSRFTDTSPERKGLLF